MALKQTFAVNVCFGSEADVRLLRINFRHISRLPHQLLASNCRAGELIPIEALKSEAEAQPDE